MSPERECILDALNDIKQLTSNFNPASMRWAKMVIMDLADPIPIHKVDFESLRPKDLVNAFRRIVIRQNTQM